MKNAVIARRSEGWRAMTASGTMILIRNKRGKHTMADEKQEYGGALTWMLDEQGVLIIRGEGEISDYIHDKTYDATDSPWDIFRDLIHTIVIENGVTAIGQLAFYRFDHLTSVSIPESVRSIGSYAFMHCEFLQEIALPRRMDRIGNSAFYGCHRLKSVIMPDYIEMIGSAAFYACESLPNVILPDGIKQIESNVFTRCSSLSNVSIPNSVAQISSLAFLCCVSLNKITYRGTKEQWDKVCVLSDFTVDLSGGNWYFTLEDDPLPFVTIHFTGSQE